MSKNKEMNKNKLKKINIIIILIILILLTSSVVLAKYKLTRQFSTTISSAPFYFNATSKNKVVFERTSNTSDSDILTTTTTTNLTINNNDGTNYNAFDTEYEISVLDTSKFTFTEGDKITKTIKGKSKIDEEVTLNIKIKNLESPQKVLKLRIKSTKPYEKIIDLNLEVEQKGAIQTIEDLVDLSIASRGANSSEALTQRYKMTRNLDFKDKSSYDNADRIDYGDTNGDSVDSKTLFLEMTEDAGFLPIATYGENEGFKGVFNGGNYKLSNLRIYKSLEENIGLFGYANGANIRDLVIVDGDVHNQNQTAGMIVGKMDGGIIQNINVEGKSVVSLDEKNLNRDTYAGGIAGYVEKNATIRNCINKASVETRFTGDVSSYSGAAGGITAWMKDSTIELCSNYGKIVGQKFIGGIAGFAAINGKGTVKNCHNYADVTTYITGTSSSGPGQNIGGIAGYNGTDGIIESCGNHQNAVISGVSTIGGIVGRNLGAITNCKNYKTTTVSGGSKVGRIAGNNTGTITGCDEYAVEQ